MISEEEFNKLKKDMEYIYARYREQADEEFMRILPSQLDKTVWDQTISLAEIKESLTLDDISDGVTFGRILATSLQDAKVLLSQAAGDLDDIEDGVDYGRVLITSIQAGKIVLAEAVGDLDDIANGTNYGKVALTSISAGKIIVAGLDSGVTDLMFSDLSAKSNIEAWMHTSDITMIDGGKIYANSIILANSANDFDWGSLGDDGNKPDNNADVTGDNTAADTAEVGGLAASNIAGWAMSGYLTYIDGGKIYTGTIGANQIAANAVAVGKLATDALARMFQSSTYKSSIEAWAKSGAITYIDGAKIYTGSISASQISVTSLAAIESTLGTVYAGTIHTSRFYVGGGTDEDIYFEDSGVRMYDNESDYLKQIGFNYGTKNFANLWHHSSDSKVALSLYDSSGSVHLRGQNSLADIHTTHSIFQISAAGTLTKFNSGGVVILTNLGSNPSGVAGGICMVSGQLKYWNGSAWVNA